MLEVAPEAVAELAELKPGAELPDVAEVEQRLERLRRERERLGAVNLRAEEELTRSRPSTRRSPPSATTWSRRSSACARASRASTARRASGCLSSFEVVNDHFKRLFTELFGGGTAELQLIENEDPLEAGLEIIAKPPGKKPATLVAAVGRRAGADRAGADLRGVPDQPGADLRARRGRRAARRSQHRALLRPARRDDAARPTPASSSSPTIRSPWRG